MFSDSCPICGLPAGLAAHAVIAPFVAELTDLPIGKRIGYRQCAHCGLGFFDHRYSTDEASRLYAGYRGADYVAVRRSWEPWYRDSVNDAFVPGSPGVSDRVRFASDVMARGGLRDRLACAVDFGGDRGQFFPNVQIDRRIVIDISDQPLLPGVERVPTLQDLVDAPDLVIAAHVLEHLSDPRALLEEVRQVLAPDGFLYVEVPLDRPKVRGWHRTAAHARWTDAVSRWKWPFLLADVATGAAKQFRLTTPRLGVLKQSEHINFFDPSSLRKLLESSGFHVTGESAEPDATVGGLRLGRLGMVATLTSPTAVGR